jgi:hypothetical protein
MDVPMAAGRTFDSPPRFPRLFSVEAEVCDSEIVKVRWSARLAVMVVLAFVLAGCGANDDDNAASGGAPGAATSSPTATSPQSPPTPTAPTPTPPPSPRPVLADGLHPVLLKDADVPDRTVTFDLIRFLTGDEAKGSLRQRSP